MKNSLPGRAELLIFIAMALVAGLVVTLGGQRDTMLFLVTLPVFIVGALMGFRRSLATQPIQAPEEVSPQMDTDEHR